jgi:hypothetical protein
MVPSPKSIHAQIECIGDAMLAVAWPSRLRTGALESVWGDAPPVLRGVDAVIANPESGLTAHQEVWREPKTFHSATVSTSMRATWSTCRLASRRIAASNQSGMMMAT